MHTPNAPVATREAWQDYLHQRYELYVGEGTIIPPLTALNDSATAVHALTALVHSSWRADGSHDSSIAGLHASPNWNDLAGGARRDIPTIVNDPYARPYLQARALETHEASSRLRQDYSKIAEQFITGVRKGIAKGYIPKNVEDRLEPAVAKTAIGVVDRYAYSDNPDKLGEYEPDENLITIADHVKSSYLPVVTGHELMHNVTGGAFTYDSEGNPVRTRMGFYELGCSGKELPSTEIFNHHALLGAFYGDFETVDPDLRADGDTGYYHRRKLWSVAQKRSNRRMTVRANTRAIFEDGDHEAGVLPDYQAMLNEYEAAYGADGFDNFNTLCRVLDVVEDDGELVELVKERIHGPKFDDNGVMQPGYIDTTGFEAYAL